MLAPIEHYDVPTWCRVLHVNLTAAFALTQVLLPALRASADASMRLHLSSVGRRGRAYWGAYAVSKFGVEGLSAGAGRRARATSATCASTPSIPGRRARAMRRQAYPAEDLETLPLPEVIAAPYLWLLGPDSRGVTGQSLDAQASPWPRPPR